LNTNTSGDQVNLNETENQPALDAKRQITTINESTTASTSLNCLQMKRKKKLIQVPCQESKAEDKNTDQNDPNDWGKIESFFTPSKLLQLGSPDYTIIASCLGVRNEFINSPARKEDFHSQLNELINSWKRTKTNQDHLLSDLVKDLERGQKVQGSKELNLLIAELKRLLNSES